jgi:hypothetical protein
MEVRCQILDVDAVTDLDPRPSQRQRSRHVRDHWVARVERQAE